MTRYLGERQQDCLDGLDVFKSWSRRDRRWTWSTPSETTRIFESLVRRGLVTKTIEDGVAVYRRKE
ncbi:MAG: hypothetical protein AMJ72_05415 [Acidithiobacillales bacterium SM1_46]|nr:MAG: hypothetical protein AMJ72_05415 [Acidithiobacillales bacterium SM1_46]